MLRPVLAIASLCLPVAVWASPLPPDRCAVLVATADTLPGLHAELSRLSLTLPVDAIYQTRSGTFSASLGLLPVTTAEASLNELIAAGEVPGHAICHSTILDSTLWLSDSGTPMPGASAPGTTTAPTAAGAAAGGLDLQAPFDASLYAPEDLRLLKAALSYRGWATGPLTPGWDAEAQAAFDAYSREIFDDAPVNAYVSVLTITLDDAVQDEGWHWTTLPAGDIPILMPAGMVAQTGTQDPGWTDYRNADASMTVSVARLTTDKMRGQHDWLRALLDRAESTLQDGPPEWRSYGPRRDVSESVAIRSTALRSGEWLHVSAAQERRQSARPVQLIAASYGVQPFDLAPVAGGVMARTNHDWRVSVGEIPPDDAPPSPPPEASHPETGTAEAAPPGAASNDLLAPFSADGLSQNDLRALQAALALRGYYFGPINGIWEQPALTAWQASYDGQRFDYRMDANAWHVTPAAALNAYARDVFGRGEPLAMDAAVLLTMLAEEEEAGDWHWLDPSGQGVNLLMPRALMEAAQGTAASISYSLNSPDITLTSRIDANGMAGSAGMHDNLSSYALLSLSGPELRITIRRSGERLTYLRSDLLADGRAVVTELRASGAETTAGLIATSIDTPRPYGLSPEPGGLAEGWMRELARRLEPPEASPGPGRSDESFAEPPAQDEAESSGTGFRVAADGTIVTNHHVIAGCRRITADGREVRLIEQDDYIDLAVLAAPAGGPELPWLTFAEGAPRLNTDVTVVGYPLYGILGGINVTRGTITGLSGLGGSQHIIQISAPIHEGNSGGPVANASGQVVAVVVSKIDDQAMRRRYNVSTQNINFAIRAEEAIKMLSRLDIDYRRESVAAVLSPEDLADRVIAASVLIECF